ncbi:MAG: hypothetical protein CVU09_10385 [Bacteroidetes bacterium HGW-Bacteroidetes-4]|jgi:ATP-dependent exoDNAse (exonuclease V) beta subunit|nr:MAG: hypothetical protein CVU09_10385 [Bacteroidetes bacterium HGW-Bacteroidetes-4]
MSLLTVYTASAGSGKTFQLTGEYLKLIFNPEVSFRSILAVTFTNKATAEMRDRILSELYLLATSQKSNHANALKECYQLNDRELAQRATFLLKQIVHNYSRFNISTIDSFFQIILKALTREIGLNASLNVELNQNQIIEKSVEDFFSLIDEKPQLKHWLSEFAIQKIHEGKSWDVQKDVLKFATEAFNETFFSLSEADLKQITSLESFKLFKKELAAIMDPVFNKLRDFGIQALKIIRTNGLQVDDFQYKNSGVAGFFIKLQQMMPGKVPEPGVRVLKAYASPDGMQDWCAKSSANAPLIQQCVQSGLQDLLNQCVDFYNQQIVNYNTAHEVYKNLDVFALLSDVFNHLRDYCNEQDIFLLSMASPFLAKLIDKNDAPFIYEKTGEYLKYYMIDEFQDTSRMQWQNFYPLFFNSISQGNRSLVVGDVKQSIYRWRNSDWNLLHSELLQEFAAFGPNVVNLPNNYRSQRYVVEFNNWCFSTIAAIAQSQFTQKLEEGKLQIQNPDIITQIYQTVKQDLPENKINTQGFVSVRFNSDDNPDNPAELQVQTQLIENLNQLFENGYQPRDVAVLVRKNAEGALVAKWLMQHRQDNPKDGHLFAFVSNDSVFLNASLIVNYLIAAIRFLIEPKNELNNAELYYFYTSRKESPSGSVSNLAAIDFSDLEAFLKLLPHNFVLAIDELRQLPLTTLVNRLLNLLIYPDDSLNISQNFAFIQTFQDAVLQFSQKQGNNLASFIEWWKQTGNQLAVSLSEEQNAIRILTIHKSKGLQYKAVILPFVNWTLDQQSKLIWAKPENKPFNSMPVLPITYSAKLLSTHFGAHYMHEYLMAIIDSLNMAYVAFTRAENALFIIAPLPKKNESAKRINDVLYRAFTDFKNKLLPIPNTETFPDFFTYGVIPPVEKIKEIPLLVNNTIPQLNTTDFLKLRLKGQRFFQKDNQESEPIYKGQIFHALLEHIFTPDDIPNAVEKLIGNGLIHFSEKKLYIDALSKLISHTAVNSFFTSGYKTITEASIMLTDGALKRPDRVLFGADEVIVIDYKYTLSTSDAHKKQVQEYMQAISQIENKPVKGFVWYLINNHLVEVNSD